MKTEIVSSLCLGPHSTHICRATDLARAAEEQEIITSTFV